MPLLNVSAALSRRIPRNRHLTFTTEALRVTNTLGIFAEPNSNNSGATPGTDLALSRRCLKRTRPPVSSAQPKVSPRSSSRPSISSSPLLGAWARLKTSRSGGLSGSVTCSRVAGSGATAPRGTSREPLTCRTGARLFTVEEKRRNEYCSIRKISE